MSAASEAFDQVVVPEVDDAVQVSTGLDEDPRWVVACSGEVIRITTVRRCPDGSVWIEGRPVSVAGFNHTVRQTAAATLELRRRTAVAIARAEGLKDALLRAEAAEALGPILGNLSAAQLDGLACAYCGRDAADPGHRMVPLKVLTGPQVLGRYYTLFVCDPDCRKEAR